MIKFEYWEGGLKGKLEVNELMKVQISEGMVKQRYKHEIVGGKEFRRSGSNLSLPHIHKGDCLAQRGLSSYYLAIPESVISS